MPFSLHGAMKFIADLLNQAHTGEQAVVGLYPEEFAGLRVRVSFGRGMPAHIPWIAFLADGMEVRNRHYPNYLYYKKNKKLVLVFGISEENQHHRQWRADTVKGKPRVREVIQNPYRYGDSYVYKIYDVREQNGVRQICYGNQQVSEEKLKNDLEQICEYYERSLSL